MNFRLKITINGTTDLLKLQAILQRFGIDVEFLPDVPPPPPPPARQPTDTQGFLPDIPPPPVK